MSSNPGAARMADVLSVGLLTASVPRQVIDDAVAAHGRGAKRAGGALPPHLMVYYAMAMAMFADEDYVEVMNQMAEPLRSWGGWDPSWVAPTSGSIAKARARLGFEPVREVFEQVAQPVATMLTRGAWMRGLRLVSIDGMVFDLPDSPANAEYFGYPSGGALPQARVVTLTESGSHCSLGAAIGPVAGKGTGERTAARALFPLLDQGMLFTADRGFYSFDGWCAAADTGAALLWRVGDGIDLPLIADLGEGTYTSVVFAPRTPAAARERLIAAARAGDGLAGHRDVARLVRIVEYYVDECGPAPGERELIVLMTTITDPAAAWPGELAHAYGDRWEHEGANAQIKTVLRGPGRVLRSKSPDLVRQEIYGYLLAHYAVTALICTAATETDLDPDRVKFTSTVRLARRRIGDPEAFSP